jgi:hypothetical protein
MSKFQGDCHALGFPRNDHQVNMVGHQTIAKQRNTMLFKVLPQQVQIDLSVRLAVQDVPSGIAALGHVVRNIDCYYPRKSCHVS